MLSILAAGSICFRNVADIALGDVINQVAFKDQKFNPRISGVNMMSQHGSWPNMSKSWR
jgi:hypothetical protein